MEQLTKLKRLRIKKDELLITIREKEEANTKSAVYLAIFVLLLIWMAALLSNPSGAQDPNSMNEAGAKALRYISGKFLILSLVLMYRTYKINKEIKELEKEYAEMKKGVGYLSN